MKQTIILLIFFISMGALGVANAQSIPIKKGNKDDFKSEIDSTSKNINAVEKIVPWNQFVFSDQSLLTTDSLLRWQIWPNWGDFYAYKKDVISFRQGTTGRIDAFQISGYNPYEQSLNLEGIDLSNPITGLVNYNYVPHHKIGRMFERKSSGYHSNIELKKYYILQPISFLNYDETDYNYRNLEFMVAQNFSERTHLELTFWDRRDGDNYQRNDVLGNQLVARGYHYLNQNIQIRTIYLRNQFEIEEPFGYSVSNPLAFAFDRFSSSSNISNAASTTTRRDWITGIYHRADSNSVEDAGLEVTLTKNDFNLPFSIDTLNWDLRKYNGRVFKIFNKNVFTIKVEANAGIHSFKENRNISVSNWSDIALFSEIAMNPNLNQNYYARATLLNRSDGFSGSELGGGVNLKLGSKAKFNIDGTFFSRMPSIQELYWSSINYSGNSNLENEIGFSLFSSLELEINKGLVFGASGRIKQAKDDVFLGSDSTFVNSGNISVISGTVFGSFENHRFELESSATLDAFNNVDGLVTQFPLDYNEQKLWVRNNIFIKGYAFDRATFLKLGVRTTLSPLTYGSKFFNTELQYWQANSLEVDIPAFFRLDAELSARVRSIMVVLRWENALDGVGQLGYFEAATFPMPARRLIVGIRAQFRN